MSEFKSKKAHDIAVALSEDEVEKAHQLQKKSPLFTVIFAGCALMSDGYQVGVLSLVNVCFSRIYGDAYTSEMSTRLGNALFCGIVLGQIGFGFFIDRVGRKVGMMVTTFLVILGAALCAGAYGANGSVTGLFWALTIYRGILGVGVGGEYPCSSANASENADNVLEGRRGMLALSVLYFRMRMTNSEIFKQNSIKRNVPYLLIVKRYWRHLIGTGGAWFIYNFITYPFGIFSGTILDTAIGTNGTFTQIASWSCLLNFMYMPGCVLGAVSADTVGRKRTMALGFFLQGVLGILMGIFYKDLVKILPLFVVLYGIFLTLGEYGPGDMTILIAAEVYPTGIRGTAYGWSAAIGKIGAICGTTAFKPAIKAFGNGDALAGEGRVFILASCLALVGAAFVWMFIPDRTRQDLKVEDEAFKQYLIDNGYDISYLGEPSKIESHESLENGKYEVK
ncbi:Plasma membrane permease, mediates uptake of glycerophosphoinositol and glycerophosphocholine [Podila horticola]|nr:Plasma membrane permease, mediates uptake of glycerophosphoinositol and glycerophosphocholine [Podila horticola]